MKISKNAACKIATSILVDKKKKVDDAMMEYRKYATEEYKKSLPKLIVEAFEKHPEYINTCTNLMANWHGFNYEHIYATEAVIQNRRNSYNNIPLTAKNSEVLVKLKRNYERLRDNYNKLLKETEIALVTLSTTKRIEDNFPEAKPFLPAQSMLPSINLDGLRKQINS